MPIRAHEPRFTVSTSKTVVERMEPRNAARLSAWMLLSALTLLVASCGGSSGGGFNPPPPPSAKEALYLSTALSSGQILTYIFDTGSGTVGAPTPVAGPPSGRDMKIYPGGTFLYVSDFDSGSVFGFSIDRSTGLLTRLSGSPFSLPNRSGNGGPIAIDPGGKFLFSSTAGGAIGSFTINSQTGFLTPGPATAIQDNNVPNQLLVDPTGKFLVASNHVDASGNNYSVFSIDPRNAVLTVAPGSPFTIGQNTGPRQILFNSAGSVLYAALSNSEQVAALEFDSATGRLLAIQGSPYPAGMLPMSIALLPSGAFLYAGNNGAGTISEFSVNSTTGGLTPGSIVQVGNPTFLDIDSSGQFLLIIGTSLNSLTIERINPTTGSLTLLNNTNFPASSSVTGASFLVPLQ